LEGKVLGNDQEMVDFEVEGNERTLIYCEKI